MMLEQKKIQYGHPQWSIKARGIQETNIFQSIEAKGAHPHFIHDFFLPFSLLELTGPQNSKCHQILHTFSTVIHPILASLEQLITKLILSKRQLLTFNERLLLTFINVIFTSSERQLLTFKNVIFSSCERQLLTFCECSILTFHNVLQDHKINIEQTLATNIQ